MVELSNAKKDAVVFYYDIEKKIIKKKYVVKTFSDKFRPGNKTVQIFEIIVNSPTTQETEAFLQSKLKGFIIPVSLDVLGIRTQVNIFPKTRNTANTVSGAKRSCLK